MLAHPATDSSSLFNSSGSLQLSSLYDEISHRSSKGLTEVVLTPFFLIYSLYSDPWIGSTAIFEETSLTRIEMLHLGDSFFHFKATNEVKSP